MRRRPAEGKTRRPDATTTLHPGIYKAAVGLTLWLALSAWGFDGNGYADFALAVVSIFCLIVIAIAVIVGLLSRRSDSEAQREDRTDAGELRDWRKHEFIIWQGRMSGIDAIIEMLLPIGAVAFGMTAFAIVLHLATA